MRRGFSTQKNGLKADSKETAGSNISNGIEANRPGTTRAMWFVGLAGTRGIDGASAEQIKASYIA